MDPYSRTVRAGRLTSLTALVSDRLARLSFRSRRCVTAGNAMEPLDAEQLAQVAGGLDSPFLPDEDWHEHLR